MWNYIKGLLRVGIPIKTVYLGFWALMFDTMVLASVIGPLIKGEGIGEYILLAGFFCMPAIVTTEMTIKSFRDWAVVPYWGRKFGRDTLFKLLAEDRFSAYVGKDGKKCRSIKISESGRWMKIGGRYYPIPLIKGINPGNAWTLVFINGEEYEIPGLYGDRTAKALKELFPPMTVGTDTTTPERDFFKYNSEAFEMAWDKPLEEMAQADWFEVRYAWEQKYAEIASKDIPKSKRKKVISKVADNHVVYKLMFNRVMSDEEIKYVAEAMMQRRIKRPGNLFDITNYSDEFCVFNAIKVLDSMGYPANEVWIGFLFDCLKDVQKSYCDDAVSVLKNHYPKEELIKHIDAEIVKAHEANDLVWAAGLISLAKAIDYEITLEDNKADKDEEKDKEVSVCGTI